MTAGAANNDQVQPIMDVVWTVFCLDKVVDTRELPSFFASESLLQARVTRSDARQVSYFGTLASNLLHRTSNVAQV